MHGDGDRFVDRGQVLDDFGDHFLVRCPRCDGRAQVRAGVGEARVACSTCGYAAAKSTATSVRGTPTDWWFDLPLWLQAPCRGHVLWAYNEAHLRYLEEFVGARLRERPDDAPHGFRNKTLSSRLPQWLRSGHHREDVLRALSRLRGMLL